MTIPSGLSAFPITPTDEAGRIQEAALRPLIDRLATAGVDSIGLLGSTGAYMYLSRDERRRAIEIALDEAGGRTPVLVGTGALRTDDAVKLAQDAKSIGAVAGLLSATSYTPLTQDEVFEHFTTVARESGLPQVIYDNPGTTHFQFTPDLVTRLADAPGIVAIKNPGWSAEESSKRLAEQRRATPAGFSIGCSGDWMAADTLLAGADVWYSVLGGTLPRTCLRMVRAVQSGDAREARAIDAALAPIWSLFKQYSSFRVVYAMGEELGIAPASPPRPILPLAEEARSRVAEVLRHFPEDRQA